ncbi:N-acetylmuramoyl-L-alanine amidase [Thermosulfidibacter takaii ABI70S6]|uniref:N-acetylmuramoyl-L-alanine amidase n=1 Tax=Thermosulfidibacter takaii (strain DSM 17441 / JCM 13301 / NBRC 103674 / ABI70S6) TaxID=1298851 RepID=A0A0S3QTH3_THET7|nr:N-acetylmuramoyl-L-alanine amidase [Thermosulfidibacter takaii]BAT71619.1 N-acetylmuramoyl-L-alanine amidase [Thermosulfidibacter takaii ABI70S6]
MGVSVERFRYGITTVLLIFTLGSLSYAAYTTQGINFWSAPDHTRVVVALKRSSKIKTRIKSKKVLEITFYAPVLGKHPRSLYVNDALIKKIQVVRTRKYNKLLIYLKKDSNFRVFTLRKYKERPYRLVVDVLKNQKEIEKLKKEREIAAYKARKKHKYVVVIDPGHGGSDPGAIGLFGIREKDIVLDISKRVVRYCNADPEITAFLTRTEDYYIPLEKRVEIAHDYGADLFISVHSNKAPNRNIHGLMAFTLSNRGVRTGLAKLLEDIENAEDVVSDIKLSKRNYKLNKTVLKVALDYSITEGERAAKLITEYVSYMAKMNNKGLRKASLKVLKNPGIPSLLLEIGFLSNYMDVAKLRSPSYRDRIAYGIYRGIKAFFNWKDRIKRERYYIVRKGDTLWKIARTYNVSVRSLIKTNNLKKTTLYPGMKLALP